MYEAGTSIRSPTSGSSANDALAAVRDAACTRYFFAIDATVVAERRMARSASLEGRALRSSGSAASTPSKRATERPTSASLEQVHVVSALAPGSIGLAMMIP